MPAPSATLSLDDVPELAWDHPANPEHLDIVSGFENRFAHDHPVSIDAPMRVVTASRGQSGVADQRFWLGLSDDALQIELEGGHVVGDLIGAS